MTTAFTFGEIGDTNNTASGTPYIEFMVPPDETPNTSDDVMKTFPSADEAWQAWLMFFADYAVRHGAGKLCLRRPPELQGSDTDNPKYYVYARLVIES